MMRRRLVYATIAVILVVGFPLTQLRVQPDVRPIGEPGDIANVALDGDVNVLFLLVDTLRADRLVSYGYVRSRIRAALALALKELPSEIGILPADRERPGPMFSAPKSSGLESELPVRISSIPGTRGAREVSRTC